MFKSTYWQVPLYLIEAIEELHVLEIMFIVDMSKEPVLH